MRDCHHSIVCCCSTARPQFTIMIGDRLLLQTHSALNSAPVRDPSRKFAADFVRCATFPQGLARHPGTRQNPLMACGRGQKGEG
jgi:hypothetical protein